MKRMICKNCKDDIDCFGYSKNTSRQFFGYCAASEYKTRHCPVKRPKKWSWGLLVIVKQGG